MKITICSSVEFTPKIIEIKKELEKQGYEVNIPYVTQKILDGEMSYEEYMDSKNKNGDIVIRDSISTDMIKRYWNLIKDSDAILVLNLKKKDIDNYIGGSVLMEMGFAYGFDKKIFLFNPIPLRNERMHYVDEILDMKPMILNGDLNKIKLDFEDVNEKLTINDLQNLILQQAHKKGFGVKPEDIDVSEKIALIHSEISEAFEAYRHKNIDGKDGFKEELGDAVQRILHLCGVFDMNIEKEIMKKLEYNKSREWDKENMNERFV